MYTEQVLKDWKSQSEQIIELVKYFEGRFIKEEYTWNEIVQYVKEYISTNMQKNNQYFVRLVTHFSVAFITGRIMNRKTGIMIMPIQKTINGSMVWDINNQKKTDFEKLVLKKERISNNNKDVAVVF
jgi:hypothetical protein